MKHTQNKYKFIADVKFLHHEFNSLENASFVCFCLFCFLTSKDLGGTEKETQWRNISISIK